MTMKFFGIGLAMGIMLAATSASAMIFTVLDISGGNPSALAVGEQITVEVGVELESGDEINALGAALYGYSNTTINFVSGVAVEELFYQVEVKNPTYCNTLPGSAFCDPAGGIPQAGSMDPANLVEGAAGPGTGFDGEPEVEVFSGLLFDPTADPPLMTSPTAFESFGLGGVQGAPQFRLVFEGAAVGDTRIEVGTGADLDGEAGGNNVVGPVNDFIDITVVPEPSAALAGLAALGSVMGIAANRRRGATP